jgi:hypothetical protein
MCRKLTARLVWVITNITLCILMAVTCIIGTWSVNEFNSASNPQLITAEKDVRAVALSLFTVLGFPLAVTTYFSCCFILIKFLLIFLSTLDLDLFYFVLLCSFSISILV